MKMLSTSQMRNLRLVTVVGFATLLTIIFVGSMTRAAQAQQFPPPGAGYLDFSYGPDVNGTGRTPTESKPESKLWWNDGFWWGSLWNPTDVKYHIYRLNWGTQTWEDTGVPIDDRKDSRGDALWDETNKKLYVASHIAQLKPSDTNNPTNYARLYRYSYNNTTRTYVLDAGFPVNINNDKTEALVLAKDPVNGRLWITYVSRVSGELTERYRVYLNASNGNDTSWNVNGALDLTTVSNISETAHVSKDDISAIVSFKDNTGEKVGILWSNQYSPTNTSLNFAYHALTTGSFNTGWTLQKNLNVSPGTAGGDPTSKGNDHMNIKSLRTATSGQVFAAIKFENQNYTNKPNLPEIGLLARDEAGNFTYRKYSNVADNDSRPLLLIDEGDPANTADNKIDLFVSGLPQGSKICYKSLALPPNLAALGQFAPGNCGTGFIVDASGVYTTFRDPTSTKQNVNNTTGLVVLASDVNGRTYAHNVMGNPPPVVTSYGPKVSPVLVTGVITATFSKPISSTTLTNLSFQVTDGVTPVAGAISYNPNTRTAIFTPNTPLKANTQYTVKLTNDIKDTTNLRLDAFKSTTPNTVVEQFAFNTGLTTVQFASSSFSVLENDASGHAVISVTLASPASQPVTVNYATSDNTAKVADGDYTASSGTLTFAPGETVKTFIVPITNDNIVEGNEAISLTLSSPSGATPGTPLAASLTIIDDEGPATVQFAPATYDVDENVAGGKVIATVVLNHSSPTPITVNYATSDGTATAGQDYTAASGTLTFAPGETTKTFEVPITNDGVVELTDETFNLVLSSPNGASLGTPGDKAIVTIHDTSSTLTVQFEAGSYTVGEADGTTNVVVKLNAPAASEVKVDYTITDGSAKAGTDYTVANSTGTLTFATGEVSKSIPVTILEDALNEDNETVNFSLSNPTGGATVGDPGQTTLTINDNDPVPTIQFSAATYSGPENSGHATITVQLSAPSGRLVGVNYSATDGTATDGLDYVSMTDESLTFQPGETSLTFDVALIDDKVAESPETVNLSLNTPTGATLGSQATAVLTILDNDSVPTVQFSNATYSVSEGAGTATITVTLSAPPASAVSVSYATSNGTATDGSDYSGSTGTLNFTAGQQSKTFTISIKQDTAVEGSETVNLALSSPSGATLGTPATAVLTILDDDVAPSGSKVFLPLVRK